MANDFRSARFWAAELIEGALHPGARALDATLGNGHDALWLCGLVGEAGRVYGFDVQAEAVARSRARLEDAGVADRATLILDGHENLGAYIEDESVDAAMFTLGWLPGAPHGVTTRTETTLRAVDAALRALRQEGILTVCVYPGHDEGARERDALLNWARSLDGRKYDVMLRAYLNQANNPPLLIAVKKNKERRGQ